MLIGRRARAEFVQMAQTALRNKCLLHHRDVRRNVTAIEFRRSIFAALNSKLNETVE